MENQVHTCRIYAQHKNRMFSRNMTSDMTSNNQMTPGKLLLIDFYLFSILLPFKKRGIIRKRFILNYQYYRKIPNSVALLKIKKHVVWHHWWNWDLWCQNVCWYYLMQTFCFDQSALIYSCEFNNNDWFLFLYSGCVMLCFWQE
jgi:hypothetical protein